MVLGGDFASIKNKKDENEIKKTIASYHHEQGFWFGLNDLASEGNFVWSDGSLSSYTNWRYGEPNGGRGENCMVSGGPMTWVDGYCDKKAFLVCYVPE